VVIAEKKGSVMPGREDLPSTLQRSPRKAQDTWVAAHDSALETYGPGRRAQQTAYAAVKHSFEKVGDHWEPKERRGPSDDQAAGGAGQRERPSRGGVDARAGKAHLYERAQQLGIPGRSRMSKAELVDALEKASRRETARARN
jgi:cation transport regulator ChaB